jgi:glycosyltransferase involved in cell wall biosynthesis
VDSILASAHERFQLGLVDQSDRVDVRHLLGRRLDDPRLHYLVRNLTGLSAGRNAGVRWASSAEVIAFTDDDCAVTPTWLSRITAPLANDPRIGIVFGTVRPAPYDAALGFLPSYTRQTAFLGRSIFDKHQIEGMGASMAIRRSTWTALHGFDEQLGAGAAMRSAEETDFVTRALLAGIFAYEVPDAVVIHAGFRTWAQAPAVLRDYLHGIGAMLAKNLKCGHWAVLAVAGRLAWRWVIARPVVDLGARPHRRARLLGFLSGVFHGWRTPVDRRTGHFEPPARARAGARTP